jgi:hypothetical protein
MDDSISNQLAIQSAAQGTPIECYGVFGVLELPTTCYLIVISQASLVGEILNCYVFRVEALLFIPLSSPVPPFQ